MGSIPSKAPLSIYPVENLWDTAEALIKKVENRKLSDDNLLLLRNEWSKVRWALKRLYPHERERLDKLTKRWSKTYQAPNSVQWNVIVPKVDPPQWLLV